MIQQTARDFTLKEIKPVSSLHDKKHQFPKKIISKLSNLGFMGMTVVEEYGGNGFDNLSYAIAIEEISKGCASTGIIISAHNSLVCEPIELFGNEDQKTAFLPDLASGKKLGCFMLSEPEAGSDPVAMKTTASKRNGSYVLNGTKCWITNGAEADVAVVLAKTNATKKHKGVSCFIIDMKTAGVKIGKLEDKLGIKASSTAQIFFDECKVPEENLLGKEGDGFKIAMRALDGGRIGVAAQAVGIAQAALEDSVRYAKERKALENQYPVFKDFNL